MNNDESSNVGAIWTEELRDRPTELKAQTKMQGQPLLHRSASFYVERIDFYLVELSTKMKFTGTY